MKSDSKYRYAFQKGQPYLGQWDTTRFTTETGKSIAKQESIAVALEHWISKTLTYWQNFAPSPLMPERYYNLYGLCDVPESNGESAQFFLLTTLEQQSALTITTNLHCPVPFHKALLGYPEGNGIELFYYDPTYPYSPADKAALIEHFPPVKQQETAFKWRYLKPLATPDRTQADDAIMYLIDEYIVSALQEPTAFAQLIAGNINAYTFYVEYQTKEQRVLLGKYSIERPAYQVQQEVSYGTLHLPKLASAKDWEYALIEALANHPPHRPLCW